MADQDEGEVQVTGASGYDVIREAPHARYQCRTCTFPLEGAADRLETAKKACPKCFCWVCDVVHTECKAWAEHCLADGSAEWAVKRQKFLRTRDAAQPQDAADVVRARFDAAAQAGQGSSGDVLTDAEAAQRDRAEEQDAEEETEELFADYAPLHLQGGQPHPDPVVETTSLSFAELPPITVQLKLPKAIFQPKTSANKFGGALSRAQLETVAYACQRHEVKLPNGTRAGFFLGDGVGLGKGRQLAGMVYDNWKRGVKRHIWISVSADLCVDAERDLTDIGADIPIYNITKLPYGKLETAKGAPLPKGGLKEGVIFATYSALMSRSQKGTRLDQMVQWMGGQGATGCILFDESHKAKHLYPESDVDDALAAAAAGAGAGPTKGKGKGKKGKSTKMAQAVQELQERCPDARVVYCSATGASSLGNMAYMERLGLWGPGAPHSDFGGFEKAIGDAGMGALELVALDMKKRGMYISRQLSFKSATFDTKVVDLTPRQTDMYDAASAFWTELHGCFATALQILNIKNHPYKRKDNPHPSGRVMTHYWGCHQRFFRQMCMAIKVPETVKAIKQALADNKCVVIGLQTTGEARLNDAVKSGENLDEFAGMKQVVMHLISKLPTGDYLNRFPESDLSDAEDSDSDDEAVQQAGKASRKHKDSRRRRSDGDDEERSEDEEMDEDDVAFLDDGSEEDEDDGDDSDSMELEGDETRKVKLPEAAKALSMPQIREVLKAAKVNHVHCTNRMQLNSRLKDIERQHLAGESPSVETLMTQLGMIKKRKIPESAAGSSSDAADGGGRRRRLSRGAAVKARSNYIELSDDDDDEVVADGDEPEVEDSGDDEAFATTRDHGLLNKVLDVKREKRGEYEMATVVKVDMKAAKKRHQVEINGDSVWLDLKAIDWRMHTSKAAPGKAGAPAKPRRKVVDSDLEDESEDEGENQPPQKRRRAKARAQPARSGKGRVAVSDDDDSASEWGGSDGSDAEDDANDGDEWDGSEDELPARGKGKAVVRPGRRAASRASSSSDAKPAAAGKGKAPARRRKKSSDDEDDEDDEDLGGGDDDDNMEQWQHDRPDQIKQLQRLKRALLKKLNKLPMPDNPLDELINELGGSDAVAEMTGRKGRLERDDDGKTVYSKRNKGMRDDDDRAVSMEKINIAERNNFMSGRKLVAIISEAASSGISLQADKRVANTRRRVHMTLELPWSADQCIQQCGRTHRSNQVCGPEYLLLMTACGGERRFAATVAKKLQQLGALTKGDRRAADASDLSQFDVDTPYGRKALLKVVEMLLQPGVSSQRPPDAYVREAIGLHANSELQGKWAEYLDAAEDALANAGIDDEASTTRFLNRILGMPVKLQNMIFSHFSAELDEQIKIAKANDKFDEGVVDIRGESIAVAAGYPMTLATDAATGVGLCHHLLEVDRGISYDRACQILDDKASSNPNGELLKTEGVYLSHRPLAGREKEDIRGCCVLTQKPIRAFALNPVPIFKLYRPGTGLGKDTFLREFLEGGRYKKVDTELAKKTWKRNYDDAKLFCSHGPNCKNGAACMVGRRLEQRHIITGAVLPFWAHMQKAIGFNVVQASDRAQAKKVSRMRIVRVRFTGADGKEQRLVGIAVALDSEMARLKSLLALDSGSSSSAAGPSGAPVKGEDVKPVVGGASGSVKPEAKPAAARTFMKYSKVQIHGLQSEAAKRYNFAKGIIDEYDAELDRYRVMIKEGPYKGTVVAIKASNLMGS